MVAVTHTKVTAKSGTSDTTLIQPTDWNASHTFVTSGGPVVLGVSGGAGAVAELTAATLGLSLLAASDTPTVLSALAIGAFTTGDVKMTFKTSADTGWVLMNDSTIGDASSGASYANANASALFSLLWTNIANGDCPVSGGRGGSAAADFAAHKTLTLPLVLGRALAGAGSGAGLTARTLGHVAGAEANAIAQTNLPNIKVSFSGVQQTANVSPTVPATNLSANNTGGPVVGGSSAITATVTFTPTGTIAFPVTGGAQTNAQYMGDGTALSVVQPTQYLNIMIKL